MISHWRILWEATEDGHRRNGVATSSLGSLADCRDRMKQIIKARPKLTFTSCKAIDPDGKEHIIDLNAL